jgi:hypothetical protein
VAAPTHHPAVSHAWHPAAVHQRHLPPRPPLLPLLLVVLLIGVFLKQLLLLFVPLL